MNSEFAVVDNGTKFLQMKSKEVATSREISAQIGYDGHCHVHFQGFEESTCPKLALKPAGFWIICQHSYLLLTGDIETLETTFDWDAEGIIPLRDTFVDVRRKLTPHAL